MPGRPAAALQRGLRAPLLAVQAASAAKLIEVVSDGRAASMMQEECSQLAIHAADCCIDAPGVLDIEGLAVNMHRRLPPLLV